MPLLLLSLLALPVAALEVLPEYLEDPAAYLSGLPAPLPPRADAPGPGRFVIDPAATRQTIWGLGFEIQSDSIGSGNHGLPESNSSVPWELTPAERTRLATELLLGFRFCRLALGLYFRGNTSDGRNIVERWPGQAAAMADMAREAQIEGFDVEYWSPPPGWKSSNSYIGGSLIGFDAPTLDAFGDAVVRDLAYLESAGLHPVQWGLQNEPPYSTPYSCCVYSPEQYHAAFVASAGKVKAAYPELLIHVCSNTGQTVTGAPIAADASAAALVDGWTWHCVGCPSDQQLGGAIDRFLNHSLGKPVWNNEFEYLDNHVNPNRTLNTAQSIMNWLAFGNSPTWYWLHALKPTVNVEAPGYGLGYWRPYADTNYSHFPTLQPGHWTPNSDNANALLGFTRYMPWDSVRVEVQEDAQRSSARVLAYLFNPKAALWRVGSSRVSHHARVHDRPGRERDASALAAATHLGVALSNAGPEPFEVSLVLLGGAGGVAPVFQGFAYSPSAANVPLGSASAGRDAFGHWQLNVTLQPLTVAFWVQV